MSLINQARQVESYETAIIGGGVVEAAKIKKLIAFWFCPFLEIIVHEIGTFQNMELTIKKLNCFYRTIKSLSHIITLSILGMFINK